MTDSLWSRVADLPLTISAHAVAPLHAPAPNERVTYLVRLRGADAEGLGEDVGGDMADPDGAFLAAAPSLAPATFYDHLAGLDLWPEPPEWDMARRWRRWAFESAALDLA